jgi:hypothetical protein
MSRAFAEEIQFTNVSAGRCGHVRVPLASDGADAKGRSSAVRSESGGGCRACPHRQAIGRLHAPPHTHTHTHTERERERRRAAIERTAGALTGVYPPGYLAHLRNEWPE